MNLFKYRIITFHHLTGEEETHKGVVLAKNYGKAVNTIVKAYEYCSNANNQYNIDVCEITIEPVIGFEGELSNIYEFEKEE